MIARTRGATHQPAATVAIPKPASIIKPDEAITTIKRLATRNFGREILFRSEIEEAYQKCKQGRSKLDEFIYAMNLIFKGPEEPILIGIDDRVSRLEAILWGAHRLSNAHGMKSSSSRDITHSSLRNAYLQFFENFRDVFSVGSDLKMGGKYIGLLNSRRTYRLNETKLGGIIGTQKMLEVEKNSGNIHPLIIVKDALDEHIGLDKLRDAFLNPETESPTTITSEQTEPNSIAITGPSRKQGLLF